MSCLNLAEVSKEYQKDSELKPEVIREFMEWIRTQPHLPEVTELQAVLFLHSCFYDLEKAKKTLDKYFTMHTQHPDILQSRSVADPLLLKVMDVVFLSILPEKTPDGYRVLLMKTIDTDPTNYDFIYQTIYLGMSLVLHLHQYGCDKGWIFVSDMKGLTFGHLARLNLSAMKHSGEFLQEAMPLRLVGLHYINVTSFIDKLMAILKPFMKPEMKKMVHFHTSSNDTLYKFVPKDMLPEEFGGKAGTIEDLRQKSKEFLINNQEFFKWHDAQVVDESKRPNKKKSKNNKNSDLNTNFKKLEID